MTNPLRRIAVYCGSSPGADPAYGDAARAVGCLLAAEGIGLVYGGGHVGLMGIVADAVLAGGGQVTGVITQHLWEREVGHTGITELLVVDSMHERKLAMSDRADAFIALPGGLGTLEEVFEVATWTQLGIFAKPVGVLDVNGYFGPLIQFLDDAVTAGFVTPTHRGAIRSSTDPVDLLSQLRAWVPTGTDKVLDPSDR